MKRSFAGTMLLLLVASLAACGAGTTTAVRQGRRGIAGEAREITIYRSPTCSCCREYETYLASAEYRVETVELADMTAKNAELGVPDSLRSCHTAKLGDYVVEGHVPLDVLDKLMREKPAVSGIALPGMPTGAPGMGTAKAGPLHIMSFDRAGAIEHYAAV